MMMNGRSCDEMAQDISVRISADVRDAEKSIGDLEKRVERLSDIKDRSDSSGGNLNRKDAEELRSVTSEFENIYSNITGTLKRNLDDLQSRIDEFDRALESAKDKQDEKMSQACQSQINYLNTLRAEINATLNTADDLRRRQESYSSGIGNSGNASGGLPPNLGGGYGGGGAGGYGGGGIGAPPLPVPPGNTGGGGGAPAPYSGGGNNNGGDGGNSNNPNGNPGNNPNGGGGNSILSYGMMALGLRSIYGYASSGYDLMNRDEDLSYRVAQKTGDFGSDFRTARKSIEATGVANGYTGSETSQTALIYEGIGGVTDTRKSLKDVEAIQGLSRAYAVDSNEAARVSGSMNRMGATQEGDQRKFAGMIGESIKEQGMQGRESELLEATNNLAQNVANNKLSVSNGDLTNIMGLQNALSQLSPQLKGAQGAEQLANLDNNIHNADNNMQIALGRGTQYAGPGGMWQLQKQMEKGISDPENVKQIFTNVEKQSKGNKNIEKMYLKNITGWKTDLIDKVVDDPELYKQFKNGDFSSDAVKALQDSDGSDLDKKLKDYKDSGVSRRKDYDANKENTKKSAGDMIDGVVAPFQNFYNDHPAARMGMDIIGGAGGYMLMSQLFKRSGSGIKSMFGGLFGGGSGGSGGSGPSGGGSGGSGGPDGQVFSNMDEAQSAMNEEGSLLRKAGSAMCKYSKYVPVVGGALAGASAYSDSKAKGDSTGEAVAKGAGATAGGVGGGMVGESIGAAIGTAIAPGLGTAIGGFLGSAIGSWFGSSAGASVAGTGYEALSGTKDGVSKGKEDLDKYKKEQDEKKKSKQQEEIDKKPKADTSTPKPSSTPTTIIRKSTGSATPNHGYQKDGSVNDELHSESGESKRFTSPFGAGKPYDGIVSPKFDGTEIKKKTADGKYSVSDTKFAMSKEESDDVKNKMKDFSTTLPKDENSSWWTSRFAMSKEHSADVKNKMKEFGEKHLKKDENSSWWTSGFGMSKEQSEDEKSKMKEFGEKLPKNNKPAWYMGFGSSGAGITDSQNPENPNNPNNIVAQRAKQQDGWKQLLDKEEDLIQKRSDLSSGSSDSKGDKENKRYWSDENTKSVTDEPKQESFLEKIGDWFSKLFGFDKKGGSEGSSGHKISDYENIPLSSGSLDGYKTGTARISDDVMKLKDRVAAEAKKNGIEDQVDVMMAQIMQESGGSPTELANDPMQSAEGHGMAAGSLHDQNKSIEWGVEEYAKRLKESKGNVPLALQSYNFGEGFIGYVNSHGGKMSQDLVNSFSNEEAQKMGWKSYGDKNYVSNVLRYYQGGGGNAAKSLAIGSKSLPEDGLIYAHKGERVTPASMNPDNPTNVSSQQALEMFEGSSSGSSGGSGREVTINVVVSGGIQGLNAENQSKVTSAITHTITENSKSLVSLLENGVTRGPK
jgi:hypothetical protein